MFIKQIKNNLYTYNIKDIALQNGGIYDTV